MYLAALVVVAIGHLLLCYPAATCRNQFHLDPFWRFVAIYVGYFAIAIPPLFSDLSGDRRLRNVSLAWFSIWSSAISAIVATNVHTPPPHIGHLVGFIAVPLGCPIEFMLNFLGCLVVATPFIFCWESVSQQVFTIVRRVSRNFRS